MGKSTYDSPTIFVTLRRDNSSLQIGPKEYTLEILHQKDPEVNPGTILSGPYDNGELTNGMISGNLG